MGNYCCIVMCHRREESRICLNRCGQSPIRSFQSVEHRDGSRALQQISGDQRGNASDVGEPLPALPCESSLDGGCGCGLLVSSCCARAMRQPCLARCRCIPWTGAGPTSASSHISCHSRISIFPARSQSARPLGEVRLLSRLDHPD